MLGGGFGCSGSHLPTSAARRESVGDALGRFAIAIVGYMGMDMAMGDGKRRPPDKVMLLLLRQSGDD